MIFNKNWKKKQELMSIDIKILGKQQCFRHYHKVNGIGMEVIDKYPIINYFSQQSILEI